MRSPAAKKSRGTDGTLPAESSAVASGGRPLGASSLAASRADLENLISALEVRVVALSECLVSAGHRLELEGLDHPGIHYNLVGEARMSIRGGPPIALPPRTLVILPPNNPLRLEGSGGGAKRVGGPRTTDMKGAGFRRFVAGDPPPDVVAVCGFFEATYGLSTHLFRDLDRPIIEHFVTDDRVHAQLENALTEVASQEVGSRAMGDALLKQVMVHLIRRSVGSMAVWAKRFVLFRDPQIARAFGLMVASPGSDHTILSLASAASLGRSAFMVRFTAIVGESPMTVLRDLRMRQATQLLATADLSIDQVAESVGYASRSSFVRAFRRAHRVDPSEYRGRLHEPRET
ncbi:MAG: AraC family transcriptional regulator [Polyangiaceae bacterium]|jgi:AraC family transcriptional activator of mtrCDE